MVKIGPALSCILAFGASFIFNAAIFVQPVAAQQSAAQAPTLTLDQALTSALANNRNVKIASLGVDAQRQQILVAKSKRFPVINTDVFGAESLGTIGLTIKQGQIQTRGNSGPIPAEDIHISSSQTPTAFVVAQVSQPLLALHKINLNVHAAQLAVAQANAQSSSTRQSISASVRQAYYGVVQAQEAVKAVQADIKQYEELDRITTEYVNEKTALESAILQVQAKLAEENIP